MKLLKFLLTCLFLVCIWSATVLYGAISGWWLTPLAERGDTAAFMDAAIRLASDQSRGNIALVSMRNGVVLKEHFQPSIDPLDRENLFPLTSMSK